MHLQWKKKQIKTVIWTATRHTHKMISTCITILHNNMFWVSGSEVDMKIYSSKPHTANLVASTGFSTPPLVGLRFQQSYNHWLDDNQSFEYGNLERRLLTIHSRLWWRHKKTIVRLWQAPLWWFEQEDSWWKGQLTQCSSQPEAHQAVSKMSIKNTFSVEWIFKIDLSNDG